MKKMEMDIIFEDDSSDSDDEMGGSAVNDLLTIIPFASHLLYAVFVSSLQDLLQLNRPISFMKCVNIYMKMVSL